MSVATKFVLDLLISYYAFDTNKQTDKLGIYRNVKARFPNKFRNN